LSDNNPASRLRPLIAAIFALLLLALGFIVGYGYQTLQPEPLPPATPPPGDANLPTSVVKGLHISPDDRLVALTNVNERTRQSQRLVVDLQTLSYSAESSPRGWQDYIAQWSADGSSILFERERIPTPPDETRAGLFRERVQPAGGAAKTGPEAAPRRQQPEALTLDLPPGEKVIKGLWARDGRLVVRTRRETKALFLREASGAAKRVDSSPGSYAQHREVLENGKSVFYVVRDVSAAANAVALYRVQDGQSRKLTADLGDVAWSYVAENGRWMMVCRQAAVETELAWSLYRVTPQQAVLVKEGMVPADINAVYWSPDFKSILGAWGKSLWVIDIPTLKVRKLGARDDWSAQDVAWYHHENAVLVAADGKLWKVDVATGKARELWGLPRG